MIGYVWGLTCSGFRGCVGVSKIEGFQRIRRCQCSLGTKEESFDTNAEETSVECRRQELVLSWM